MNYSFNLFDIPFSILCISLIICLARMFLGPSIPDRVVALDLLAILMIATVSIYSILIKEPVYIDVVIALALVIFLGTVAFAKLITWRKYKE